MAKDKVLRMAGSVPYYLVMHSLADGWIDEAIISELRTGQC